ncbi:MAG: 2-dehydropantoate 2-reductase [Lachnospiraceae bacterium]|nr:2-dehydropantoate 2-reductase [Lachnospiraceae bacterium]
MRFYVDYDDCLCETARAFSKLAARLFDKDVPYEKIHFFNLRDSFDLTEEEYELLMTEGHRPEELLSYEETPGASRVLNEWLDQGHELCIITGRPFDAYEASRRWLDEHGFGRVGLYCLDKYGRASFNKGSSYNLTLEDYYRMTFDFAIEDSPLAFRFFEHLPDLKVLVYDRPWNREGGLPGGNYSRCPDWESIRETVGGK